MKDAATKSYSKKGEKVVAMNHAAIDRGVTDAVKVEIPAEWKNAVDETVQEAAVEGRKEVVDYVNNILTPVNAQRGDSLPVSAFVGLEDGTMPQGTAAYEKRGIAVDVPEWMPENCIQCNFCAYVCPHSVIRPIPMTEAEVAAAPEATKSMNMTGMPDLKFVMTVSTLDCTGCGCCAQVCPGKRRRESIGYETN